MLPTWTMRNADSNDRESLNRMFRHLINDDPGKIGWRNKASSGAMTSA